MNQVVSLSPSTNVEAYRAATDAADLCKEIVLKSAVEIQRRRYVPIEGWQAIAVAHGCAASARNVERVEGGVRAIGEVRRMSDGALISQGEGFVGEDEATWYGGLNQWGKQQPKRADYAIRAMAQTRAMSRACRAAFAHVVVMMNAGLATTPAEEVPYGGFDNDAGEVLEGTPQVPKTANAARKDGDFERLTAGLAACQTEADLEAWATAEKDAIGALPHGWQRNMRAEYSTRRGEIRLKPPQSAQDGSGGQSSVFIEPPAPDATLALWTEYFEDVLRCIGGAVTEAEVHDAMATNSGGIEQCSLLIPDAESRVAAVGEARVAELVAKAA